MLWLLALTALAAPQVHYHPDEVARASDQYARAAEQAGRLWEQRVGEVSARADALLEWELGIDLLGEAAEGDRAALKEQEERFHREKAVIEVFGQVMMDDFNEVFSTSMERALAALPGEELRCAAQIPVGRSVPGIPQRMQDNPDCTGPSASEGVAQAMDRDPALRAALDEILALEWPALSAVNGQSPAYGGGDGWLSPQELLRRTQGEALRRIAEEDDAARVPFQAALEEGESPEALRALLDRSHAIDAQTAAARTALGAPVLALAEARLQRAWATDPGWCARPASLGGCAGEDRTVEGLKILRDDGKFARRYLVR
ncbi:MAG: hypothetical protein JXX28_04190 [Deltaproteobacteria bacterium]|nr:hypothetical protein [Deltaproteobacteria bacterium]